MGVPIRKAADFMPLSRYPLAIRWLILAVLSVLLVALLEWAGLSAALLLGPMVAGIVVAIAGADIRTPKWSSVVAQGIVGCMIARTLSPAIIKVIAQDWPLFVSIVLAAVVISTVLGWLLGRWKVLPPASAVWGSSPGAATAMTLMAGEFGGDTRLVAFMQYSRVIMVTVAASLVTHWGASAEVAAPQPWTTVLASWFAPVPIGPLALTVVLAVGGALAGRALRIPAGSLMLPLVLASVLHGSGTIELVLPQWLLAFSYALVGWGIGLTFTRAILVHAAYAMPGVGLAILIQIGLCAGLGVLLSHWTGIDPVTAFLATSPGGADSIAIISASGDGAVDASFVMALQSMRLFIVVLLAPGLARWLSRRTGD